MRRSLVLLKAVLLFALLVAASAALPATDDGPDKAEAQRNLDLIRERIRSIEGRIQRSADRRSQLDSQLRSAEVAAARSRQALAAVRRELAAARRKRDELTRAVTTAENDLARQRSVLAGHVRVAWVQGRAEPVRVALSQGDPADVGRRLTWLAFLTRNRGELVASVQSSLAELRERQAAVQAQTIELERLARVQRQELATLDAARGDRALVLKQLDRQLGDQGRQLKRLKGQASSLTRLIRELERAIAASPLPKMTDGGRPLTGRWPVAGRMLADFGQPRAGGQMRWDGVLIAAAAGSDVRAIRAGRVVYSDWLPGLGLLLIIDHGGGYLTLYGHNQDLTKAVGDRVSTNEVIAHVGDTGGQGRPALYFELRRNGRPLNPRQWVR